MIRWMSILILMVGAIALFAACAGPENRDDLDPTATAVERQASEEPPPTATEEIDVEASAAPKETSTATASATATSTPTPVPPTPTPEPTATATPLPIDLVDSLPVAGQFPAEGYFLANQGTYSALDLANFYSDSAAHLERLDEWGFKEHRFREFSRDAQNESDPNPDYVLTTVNEYGSDDQAADALDWLRSLNASQGQTFVDPDPDIGDNAFASSVKTSDGTSTSIVYVQIGPRVYAYFGQGGEPLDFVLELAESNTARILDAGQPIEPTETPTE